MRYIKKFENMSNDPQIGDYIIVKSDMFMKGEYSIFLDNNIGIISDVQKNIVVVDFYNYPGYKNDEKSSRVFNIKEILYYSPNKQDLEAILVSKKYNL